MRKLPLYVLGALLLTTPAVQAASSTLSAETGAVELEVTFDTQSWSLVLSASCNGDIVDEDECPDDVTLGPPYEPICKALEKKCPK